jgi:hypothetical protein
VLDVEAGVCANDMLLYMDACIHGNGDYIQWQRYLYMSNVAILT